MGEGVDQWFDMVQSALMANDPAGEDQRNLRLKKNFKIIKKAKDFLGTKEVKNGF